MLVEFFPHGSSRDHWIAAMSARAALGDQDAARRVASVMCGLAVLEEAPAPRVNPGAAPGSGPGYDPGFAQRLRAWSRSKVEPDPVVAMVKELLA